MANMELIEAKTAGSGGVSSFDFTSIPATYTDLVIKISSRSNRTIAVDGIIMRFNNDTTSGNYTAKRIYGSGSGTPVSDSNNSGMAIMNGNTATTSTFANAEIYISNYVGSNAKSASADGVSENNATEAYPVLYSLLWSGTSAINRVTITPEVGTLILEGSTAYLYGISNVTSGSKATGGIVSSDGTYWYHMFPYSGTFTPTTAISADVLCIAGGGGSSFDRAGGGGAGGLLYSASQSLTTQAYTITIGSGGAGAPTNTTGSSGGNSTVTGSGFTTLTAVGGGYGAQGGQNGANGGSGGGSGTGGTGTAGQGNNGGTGGSAAPNYGAGAGGGAGAVGDNGTSTFGGNGGNGVNTYSSWANATQTGVNGYYAGGGGGGTYQGGTAGAGGLGGGGNAGAPSGNNTGTPGARNTGGGAGGSSTQTNGAVGAAGGSGLVIIRYAI
jgi:hypothetical protein